MRAIVAYCRWSWPGLWLVASGLLLAVEFQRQSERSQATAPASAAVSRVPGASARLVDRDHLAAETVEIGRSVGGRSSSLLVIGCLGSVLDGDIEITLQAERVKEGMANSVASTPIRTSGTSGTVFHSLSPLEPHRRSATVETFVSFSEQANVVCQPDCGATDRRAYFLPSPVSLHANASVTSIACHQIARSANVRVFTERSLLDDANTGRLADEVVGEIEQRIWPALSRLVGTVRDVDGDGTVAMVLTAQLGLSSGVYSGVDGLTRESDFRPEIPRPLGNGADVVFLNSRLPAGERLRAVLAHELAHAAIFSRRIGRDDSSTESPDSEDDWLNEALAHWIEVRASGSSSNLDHRLARFVAEPESSPLVVRDYSRPGFWRHHGCRGAAYSFLDWCVNQFGEELIVRLIDSSHTGVENIEDATGRSFQELFRGWTVALGERLAREEASLPLGPHDPHVPAEAVAASCHELRPQIPSWTLDETKSNCRTVVLKGTTAKFLRVTAEPEALTTWRLSAVATRSQCPVQLTTIPIETGKFPSPAHEDRRN